MKQFKPSRLALSMAVALVGGTAATGALAQWPQLPAQVPLQIKLDPFAVRQFVQPLPSVLNMQPVLFPGAAQNLTFTMCEFDASILPPGTLVAGQTPATRVWGYINGGVCPTAIPSTQSYLGPVIVAARGVPTGIDFVNALGNTATTGVLAYKYSVDQSLVWADPLGLGPNGPGQFPPETNYCNNAGPSAVVFGSPCAQNYDGPIAAVPHLHGGEVPPVLDGGPDAWVTSDGAVKGHAFYSMAGNQPNSMIYRYPNEQEAAPIWFHDHTLGATRLNVYAGLAGAYVVTDPNLTLAPGLHPAGLVDTVTGAVRLDVPLVVQDRMFDTAGQLFFPGDSAGGVLYTPTPEHPYWVPEFFGDVIAVNGKVWPFMTVQPQRYRFLMINGSNARAYELRLTNAAGVPLNLPIWVIGNDGGYLDAPVQAARQARPNAPIPVPAQADTLTLMPGERYEFIIDFRAVAGQSVYLTNTAGSPFPDGPVPGDPIEPINARVGSIMKFVVGPCPRPERGGCAARPDNTYDPATSAFPIRTPGLVHLVDTATGTLLPGVTAAKSRLLTLNEVSFDLPGNYINPVTGVLEAYPGGPLEMVVNNTKYEGGVQTDPATGQKTCIRTDFTPITTVGLNGQSVLTCYSELPNEGDIEIWEIVNMTVDAHPMHTHLTDFQILSRQTYDELNYTAAYGAAFPGGAYIPGFGPPLDYNTGNPAALGGNPDITPFLIGAPRPPAAYETGWKDTAIMYPGEVTRIAVRFSPNSVPVGAGGQAAAYPFDTNVMNHGYVWHCHIVDHEDNEMMRPDLVIPLPGVARTFVQGVDY